MGGLIRRTAPAAAVACAALMVAGPAQAALNWTAPEPLPRSPALVSLAPDGTGFLFGFGLSVPWQAVRPLGGPTGAPQDFAPASAPNGTPRAVYAPNGDALVLDTADGVVAFRPAGPNSVAGAPQKLGIGAPEAAAVAANGDALVAMDGGSSGPIGHVFVALRPAGAASLVDTAHAQDFGTGHVDGIALDPDGGAVVVFESGNGGTLQAFRPAGHDSFDPATIITNPLSIPENYPTMAVAPTGYAMLVWGGTTSVNVLGNRAMAAFRAPGGAFGAQHIVAQAPAPTDAQHPLEVANVFAGITSQGEGLVAWTASVAGPFCNPYQGDVDDVGAFMSVEQGGSFGAPTALGPAAFPQQSQVRGVVSGGGTIAIAVQLDHQGSVRCGGPGLQDDTSETTITLATDAPNGLAFAGPHALGAAAFGHLSVSLTGGVLVSASTKTGSFLEAYEGEAPAGGGTTTVSGATTTPGSTPVVPLKPIVPRDLISLRPIDPANPLVIALCPPGTTDCSMRVALYAAFGATPVAAAAKKKGKPTAVLLGTAKIHLAAGTTGKARIHFTAAGKKAATSRKAQKVRLLVTTQVGSLRGSVVLNTTLKPARPQAKHRH